MNKNRCDLSPCQSHGRPRQSRQIATWFQSCRLPAAALSLTLVSLGFLTQFILFDKDFQENASKAWFTLHSPGESHGPDNLLNPALHQLQYAIPQRRQIIFYLSRQLYFEAGALCSKKWISDKVRMRTG